MITNRSFSFSPRFLATHDRDLAKDHLNSGEATIMISWQYFPSKIMVKFSVMKQRMEGYERREKREERYDVLCVLLRGFDFSCFFLFSKLSDTRKISNFQNYQLPTLKAIVFPTIF